MASDRVVPQYGDYGCVTIPWLKYTVFGKHIKVPNLFGVLIMAFTGSKYCHAFIYLGDGKIMEAQPQGAKISDLSEYDSKDIIWSHDALSAAERAAIVYRARRLDGTPYGFLDILWLALSTFRVKGRWLLDKVLREDRMICSQLVASCGVLAGEREWLCGKQYDQQVTPADLVKRI